MAFLLFCNAPRHVHHHSAPHEADIFVPRGSKRKANPAKVEGDAVPSTSKLWGRADAAQRVPTKPAGAAVGTNRVKGIQFVRAPREKHKNRGGNVVCFCKRSTNCCRNRCEAITKSAVLGRAMTNDSALRLQPHGARAAPKADNK